MHERGGILVATCLKVPHCLGLSSHPRPTCPTAGRVRRAGPPDRFGNTRISGKVNWSQRQIGCRG